MKWQAQANKGCQQRIKWEFRHRPAERWPHGLKGSEPKPSSSRCEALAEPRRMRKSDPFDRSVFTPILVRTCSKKGGRAHGGFPEAGSGGLAQAGRAGTWWKSA